VMAIDLSRVDCCETEDHHRDQNDLSRYGVTMREPLVILIGFIADFPRYCRLPLA
jgi:hypothetical protein